MPHKHLTEYLTACTIMANGDIVQVPPGSFWKFRYQNLHLVIVQVPYGGFTILYIYRREGAWGKVFIFFSFTQKEVLNETKGGLGA